MILGNSPRASDRRTGQSRVTLDDLFCHAAARRPEAIALADAPNRARFTDGPPLRLTYAEADRMVSAIAGRLRQMGLPTDAIVGIQLPNTVENILTLLGVLRAGMIAAPLPLLWRQADAAAALARVGAKAFISCGHVGKFEHCQFALHIAAEVFSIRYVCGFGANLPDGVVPFDDLFTAKKLDPIPPLERDADAAAHLAVVTFEMSEAGPVPVARRHLELLAGGMTVLLESRLQQDANIFSAIAPASFAGLCLTLMPWLLSGGALALHHPFDAQVIARQLFDENCATLILPAPVALWPDQTGLLRPQGPTTLIAAWYGPEQLSSSAEWRRPDTALVDVSIFGEAGLIAARRGADGRPATLRLGPVTAPFGVAGGMTVAELGATAANTLALGGPMVPRHAFPPGIERTDQPHFEIGRDGLVDTRYPCRVDAMSNTVTVSGSLSGVVNVGGYRLSLGSLLKTIRRVDAGATLAVLPDDLIGRRLTGVAADPAAMRLALNAAGFNPLAAAAFADSCVEDQREPAVATG
jgi:AMP-binding enzyme